MRQKTKKPTKQRKREKNAPLHQRQKEMAVQLKPSLREKFEKRRVQVREGDKVKITRGDHKGKTGEVTNIDLRDYTVQIKDIERETQDQERINIKFQPSNLMITKLDLEDSKREQKIKKETQIEEEKDEGQNNEKQKEDENDKQQE